MSRIITNNLRHNDATADNLTLDGTGNITAPGNLSVTGTSTLTDDLVVDTDTLFVDASTDRVGIGTASPTADLHINTGATKELRMDGTGSSRIRLISGSTDNGNSVFVSTGDFAVSGGSATDLGLGTQASNTLITRGGAVVARFTGDGLTFGTDTAAANALDDYEEGSWTPTILGTTTDPTVSYSFQVGEYQKIGNKVTVWLFVKLSSSSGGSGDINIGSLPFNVSNDVGKAEASTFAVNYYTNTAFSSGQIPSGYGRRNDDKIYLSKLGTGTSATGVSTASLGTNWAVYGSMNYYVD